MRFPIRAYMAGVTKKVSTLPINTPPKITVPMAKRVSAPAPVERIIGKVPSTVVRAVINIG